MSHSQFCEHLRTLEPIPASIHECAQCVALGDTWVHLRVCQTCGAVNCCDNSVNRHATKHHFSTEHPVITSAEPGEQWAWCYVDEQFMEY